MALDIPQYRLHNQFLSQTDIREPAEVVRRLGAVQSQEYAGGKWALGLRMNGGTDASIDEAFNQGKILRTHILRPTWHFVHPEDIRWMLMLSAPRVHQGNGFMYRQQNVDRAIVKKSYRVFEKALQGNKHLTRTELGSALEAAGIPNAEGIRLSYFMMSAELDGVLCSGPRRGRQFTYALLEERVPAGRSLNRDEALVELTRRYFSTRGPATLHDFTWWSGLTMTDARQGVEALKPQLSSREIEGKTYWLDDSVSPGKEKSPAAYLLPNYDEYFIGFKDRSAIGRLVHPLRPEENTVALNAHIVILNGQIVGGWRRTVGKDTVEIAFLPVTELPKAGKSAIEAAARRYAEFLRLPGQVTNL